MALNPKDPQQGEPFAIVERQVSSPVTHATNPMLIAYPSLPTPELQLPPQNGALLRDIIKTCASNGIDFKLSYSHSGQFRYYSDACRTSR